MSILDKTKIGEFVKINLELSKDRLTKDIVDAINAIGTNSADLVAILEALREAGALRAQMIII